MSAYAAFWHYEWNLNWDYSIVYSLVQYSVQTVLGNKASSTLRNMPRTKTSDLKVYTQWPKWFIHIISGHENHLPNKVFKRKALTRCLKPDLFISSTLPTLIIPIFPSLCKWTVHLEKDIKFSLKLSQNFSDL